jgi:hypothetical protein
MATFRASMEKNGCEFREVIDEYYSIDEYSALVMFESEKQVKKFLLVTIIGFVLAALATIGAPQPFASPAPLAQRECDCSNLKALQIELSNAVGLQQAFQGKIADLRKLDQAPASAEFSRFAAATATRFKRPPGDTGPEAVEYTPYGNGVDSGILKTEKETPERREQLCGLSRNAQQEIDDMKRGASCDGIVKAVEVHEGVHWASCRRLGYVAFRDMHGADRAQEEVEAYGEQIKVLRSEIARVLKKNCVSYKASGESHDEVYSGVICDLAKEFTVNGTGLANFAFKFVPSSDAKKGTVRYTSSYSPGGAAATESGSGSYDVIGMETDKPRIVLTIDKATATVTAMGHSMRVQPAMAGSLAIKLTPAESECNKQ